MSNQDWPLVPLGEVLIRNNKLVTLIPDQQYREVTVRLWGKGVVLRQVINGTDIASPRRSQVSHDQFIVSRIDARNGAMGLVPAELDGAVVTNDFPTFNVNRDRLIPAFLGWLCRTPAFVDTCRSASEGTTNRVRLKEERFMKQEIRLPKVKEQMRIVSRIDSLVSKVEEARGLAVKSNLFTNQLTRSRFSSIIAGAPRKRMLEVAPLVRRKVEPRIGEEYPELGIRSFGRGSFHKPSLDYLSVGTKKLYLIERGDLVFNNVFAWEGAIAVAKPEDKGRVGSHRFITCVSQDRVVTAEFLCFYFLTPEGLEKIGEASPGGAGRNRTLGIEKLANIEVPVPDLRYQLHFGRLLQRVQEMQEARELNSTKLNAMLPSILDSAFKGAL